MPRDGESTREKILDIAQAMIMDQGFAGASVDKVIKQAGVTKGAFFHHFKTKNDLARALVERYAALDREHFDEAMLRAESLSRDPLQQVLIFVGLFIEMMESLEEPYPGCLYASYCYQSGLIGPEVMREVSDGLLMWRERLGYKFRQVIEKHPPKQKINPDSLADALLVMFEGAYIMSKTLNEPKITAEQLKHYRRYIEVLFAVDER